MAAAEHVSLYQLNTRILLAERSRELGRPATLDDVPDSLLDEIAGLGFDWVWLLGVWQTGVASRDVSRTNPEWRAEFERTLPDLRDADITGSPFAIVSYTAHADFGGDEALARVRERLASRGLRLLLDFVPNHVALDHPWRDTNPEFLVHGDDARLSREPENYVAVETRSGRRVLAYGRDPYFSGWPDTLQLNYCHRGLRDAVIGEIARVADRCDGIRCDMAMLLNPDVFRRTWGDLAHPDDGSAPVDEPFWPEAVTAIRGRHPGFVFMAEVYWDLEWDLQQQGFDYTYDKRLYDRLHARDAGAVRGHLHADGAFQRRSARFLENHDEPRAAVAFDANVHDAAAIVTYLVPGLRFFHDGQFEGRTVKLSMHLGRRPDEPVNAARKDFYMRLLAVLRDRPEVRSGVWRLVECFPAWDGNPTWDCFVAFAWEDADGRRTLVCVNYGPTRGQCFVEDAFPDLPAGRYRLRDAMGDAVYERTSDDLSRSGLFLDMPEWHFHVFDVTPVFPA